MCLLPPLKLLQILAAKWQQNLKYLRDLDFKVSTWPYWPARQKLTIGPLFFYSMEWKKLRKKIQVVEHD